MDESSLISYIEKNSRERLRFNNSLLIKSIGDDTAIFRDKNNILITSDTLTENTHFKIDYYSFDKIGAKALLANISDIASMGGTPRFFILSLLIPEYLTEENIKETIDGIIETAKNDKISLIGGNISKASEFSICITLLGDYTDKKTVLRYCARDNDLIFVSGNIGNSWLSYYIMENKKYIDEITVNGLKAKKFKIDKKTIKFIEDFAKENLIHPSRVKLGKILASNKLANSLTDISDGLYKDINNLLNNNKDKNSEVSIIVDNIPLSDDFKHIVNILDLKDIDVFNNVISFGEDYELLWSANTTNSKKLSEIAKKERIKISKIGSITNIYSNNYTNTNNNINANAGNTKKKNKINFIYKNKPFFVTPMTFKHI
ncbi:MAG: thiamine-phosphate kinase [Candidatus Acididesulfobacter diazotrophicus]|uniref:Thiamine-monophosphate kinase n=1 Tax=Candidatus Acididesulfobacter diazotrophicus TaxID=2597226 RepID=A0A519BNH9_9DELT|nr:MAG: thiamine-phosphate kinase [Candidatus Acididesulfobacter diazotrophicus]